MSAPGISVPVELTRDGRVVAVVSLMVPLSLEMADALALAWKLLGTDVSLASALSTPRPFVTGLEASHPDPVVDEAAGRERTLELQRRNLRDRAEAYDLPSLYAWLRTLDPSNEHMSVAYDIVTERIRELEGGAAPASVAPPSEELVQEARALEKELADLTDRAAAGDEQARVRSLDVKSRLMQLQQDIADGVDRRGEEPQ